MGFFAISIALATFIENDYGTISARALIFNSWWLELCMLFLCAIFIYNIYKYKIYKLNKLPILFLHLSFILIIIGAAVTRYLGKEGVMRIREGSFNNQFISSTVFLEFKLHNNQQQYFGKKSLLLSSITNNKFSIPIEFDNKKIRIEYVDFIHDPVDDLLINQSDGRSTIELIIPSKKGGMESKYISYQDIDNINDLDVGFGAEFDTDFNISYVDSVFYFISTYDVEYMRMSDQKKGILPSKEQHYLNHKTLYTINGQNLVFKNHFPNAHIIKKSANIKNDELKSDLLKIKVIVGKHDTIIDLYGHKGSISPKNYFDFNDVFFSFSYGSKNYSLPFAIFLKDFQLDRYPGSNSPSSFASEIEVLDGEKKFDYRIFMNNVLNYRGYRFFQSSYDKDEKGTILSVNKDKTGTIITYIGYLSLLGSVLSLFFSSFSRINLLSKKITKVHG